MNIMQYPSQDYVAEKTHKNLLVLHYTAGGTLGGAIASLGIRDYVNVHYMVDRDGGVYQFFPEEYWAYHTGTGLRDAKRSIGIEFVCWGHLKRKWNALYAWPNNWKTKIPWPQVIRLKKFRGFQYWHKLTPEQEEIAPILVDDICSRWPGMQVCTHADLKTTKLDFPPDYPAIRDLTTL